MKVTFALSKQQLVQGGQVYWAFPSLSFVNYIQVFKVESYVDLSIMTMKSIFY